MDRYIKGVDVSRWQGPDTDWNKVRAAGPEFAFIKATDGAAYKSQFIEIGRTHARNAVKAGLKTGYYHFAHPSDYGGLERDARDEAYFFLKTLGAFPKPDFPLVLDIEDEKMTITKAQTLTWIHTFSETLQHAGYEMMIYSYKGYLDLHLPAAHDLGKLPLWLAAYPRKFDVSQPPRLPRGWTDWQIWQYSDKGRINGISGNAVDLNIMKDTFFNQYGATGQESFA